MIASLFIKTILYYLNPVLTLFNIQCIKISLYNSVNEQFVFKSSQHSVETSLQAVKHAKSSNLSRQTAGVVQVKSKILAVVHICR